MKRKDNLQFNAPKNLDAFVRVRPGESINQVADRIERERYERRGEPIPTWIKSTAAT